MPAPQGYSTRTLGDFVGHGFGDSAPTIVDQERINAFADITGDHQWIHVDVARAKAKSPFGGPVAHGFLTLSLLAAAVGSAGVVPGDAKGAFTTHTRTASPVLGSGTPIQAHSATPWQPVTTASISFG